MGGTLVLCGTPIGNLADVTGRLGEELAQVDIVYAEDTRRSGRLLRHLGVDKPLRSFFVGNEQARLAEITERLIAGERVALVTDAGMPTISDPGLTAVRAARAAGASVTVLPGPSAVTAALAVSGLPADRFVFEGFLPRKGVRRRRVLETLQTETRTIVLFVSPQRVESDLRDLGDTLGDSRDVCVTRELTKMHEEVWWGTLGDAAATFGGRGRGEFTVVIAGAPEEPAGLEEAIEEALVETEQGKPLSSVVRDIARLRGLPRGRLYEAVLQRRLEDG